MIRMLGLLAVVLTASTAHARDPVFSAKEILARIKDRQLVLSSIGVTTSPPRASGDSTGDRNSVSAKKTDFYSARKRLSSYLSGGTASIDAVLHCGGLRYDSDKTHILLVGRSSWQSRSIGEAMIWFYGSPEAAEFRRDYVISAVPTMTPRGAELPSWSFPPQGTAYNAPNGSSSIYLWRWIGMLAPDLVVDVRVLENEQTWFIPEMDYPGRDRLLNALQPTANGQASELAAALVRTAPCEVGRIPSIRVNTARQPAVAFLPKLLTALNKGGFHGPSPARQTLQQRIDRSPLEVARQLSEHYGHDLKQVVYIPALALVGRLRLGELTSDPSHQRDVERIVEPYVDGEKATTVTNGSGLSGHLVFAELASRTEGETRARYVMLSRNAADLAFDSDGRSQSIMPYHNEMSDSAFMGGPILAHVGQLTGDDRYYEACMKHLQAMRKLVLRDDGLYRHSPLDEAAWGRGNGFPALGLAWCLTRWPQDRKDHGELLDMFRDHVAALAQHQDATGCWHQVIDQTDTYRELSCTCMITFALSRGVRKGWLDAKTYGPMIDKGWYAIRARIAPDGRLVDVCTGTGKQQTLADYYHRPAILGHDARGGAMALLVATEMADYQKAMQRSR